MPVGSTRQGEVYLVGGYSTWQETHWFLLCFAPLLAGYAHLLYLFVSFQ